MKRFVLVLAMFVMVFVSAMSMTTGSASAATAISALDPKCDPGVFSLGIPPWYKYLNVGLDSGTGDECAILPFIGDTSFDWGKALPRIGLAVTEILLRVGGLVAVAFTIYGGIRYILSQGEPDATKKAKGTIVGASIGLVIAMFASVIVGFIGAVLWK